MKDYFKRLQMEWNEIKERDKYLFWKQIDTISEDYAKKLKLDMITVFNGLQKEIVNNLNKYKDYYKAGLTAEIPLFDIDKWVSIALNNTLNNRRGLFETVINESFGVVDPNGTINPIDFESLLEDGLNQSVDYIKEPIETVDKEIRETIRQAFLQNPLATESELTNIILIDVNSRFKDIYTKSRAEVIGRTTATTMTGQGQSSTWTKYGFRYRWLSRRDGKVRKTHREADGKFPNEDGLFEVGMGKGKHPGAIDRAEESVNCRCRLFPVR